jgi:methionyl aminopeptidase
MSLIKSQKEIEIMREGGKILARVLRGLESKIKPGVVLVDLDSYAEKEIRAAGAKPSFKNYTPKYDRSPFPASICISINDEVVHGLPNDRIIKSGDLVKVDCGVYYNGFHTDSAITVGVGELSKESRELIDVTRAALSLAIGVIKDGVRVSEIGRVVEEYVVEHGFYPVREMAGHGIGKDLHEYPEVVNFKISNRNAIDDPHLKEGMTIAIEPIIAEKKTSTILSDDGFAYKTSDGSNVAHFEHTVAVTKDGCEVLTSLDQNITRPS